MSNDYARLKVDKEDELVAYNDKLHKYWSKDTNQNYISATTLIGKYSAPFDSNFWSSYKAL
jgi:hypothetical protein